MEEIEIYYRNLDEEKRKEIRKQLGFKTDNEAETEMNWNLIPITTIYTGDTPMLQQKEK